MASCVTVVDVCDWYDDMWISWFCVAVNAMFDQSHSICLWKFWCHKRWCRVVQMAYGTFPHFWMLSSCVMVVYECNWSDGLSLWWWSVVVDVIFQQYHSCFLIIFLWDECDVGWIRWRVGLIPMFDWCIHMWEWWKYPNDVMECGRLDGIWLLSRMLKLWFVELGIFMWKCVISGGLHGLWHHLPCLNDVIICVGSDCAYLMQLCGNNIVWCRIIRN